MNRTTHVLRLTKRGRPKGFMKFAFADLKREHVAGAPGMLEQITEPNMRACEALIHINWSPQAAAHTILGVDPVTCGKWLRAGEDPECPDPMKRAFFLRCVRAQMVCRGIAEEEVRLADPLAALRYGPLGRSMPGFPGWTPESTVRHTDETGEGPLTFHHELRIDENGFRMVRVQTQQIPTPQAQLGPASDAGE